MRIPRMNLPRDLRGNRKIFQIWTTRACDKCCFGCTQASNLAGRPGFMTPAQFEKACLSLQDYPGVIAMFGGNPCMHPQFEELCEIMRNTVPKLQRGIWTNNLLGKGKACRKTFHPSACNINVHLDKDAAEEIRKTWPAMRGKIKGEDVDSRHPPPFVAIQDVVHDEQDMWAQIATCDINKKWSAMIGVFRGELRGWFCEVAGAQSILHQDNPEYPDTGVPVVYGWWKDGMEAFQQQILKHCPECGIPLRGKGQLAVGGDLEQVSRTHAAIYRPKRPRTVELVTRLEQLGGTVKDVCAYTGNARS